MDRYSDIGKMGAGDAAPVVYGQAALENFIHATNLHVRKSMRMAAHCGQLL